MTGTLAESVKIDRLNMSERASAEWKLCGVAYSRKSS